MCCAMQSCKHDLALDVSLHGKQEVGRATALGRGLEVRYTPDRIIYKLYRVP